MRTKPCISDANSVETHLMRGAGAYLRKPQVGANTDKAGKAVDVDLANTFADHKSA